MRRQRILSLDIETAPMSGYMWRPKTEYIPHGQRIEESIMLTWAARWRGMTRVEADWLRPAEIERRDDAHLVESLAELVREADIVIAHNAARFDVPRLNTRLMLLELEPLTPTRLIDTLQVARKSFDLPYTRLDYLAQVLIGAGKMETDFDLWRNVMAGDEKAMRYMVRYNRKDVRLMDEVFDRMAPYARSLPRMVRAEYDMEWACPFCGSADVIKRGRHDTNAQGYQTWQCKTCKRYSRERKYSEPRLALVPVSTIRSSTHV